MIPNIVESYEKYVQDHIEVWPQHKNRASSSGHPCERFLVYSRLNSQDRLKNDLGFELICREGNHQEKAVIDDLAQAGMRIEESQRAFEWKEYELTGRIDGMIPNERVRYPVEIKSMEPNTWAKINSAEDLKNSFKYYLAGYYAQIQLYLLMNNSEAGVILLKNKVSGRIKQLNVALDYDYAEGILKKLERVNTHVKAKTYPDRPVDRTPCQWCQFRHICLPDESSESIHIEDSQELIDLLEERERLREAAQNYDAIDEKVKQICKPKPDGAYLIGGKFQIKISTSDRKFTNIPPELKAKYEETKPVTVVKITALK